MVAAEGTVLHLAHRATLARIRANVTRQVLAADRTSLDGWLGEVVPFVLSGQRQSVVTTDAYLSLEAGLATSTPTTPWGLDPDRMIGRIPRGGVTLEDVYARTLLARIPGPADSRLEREVATDITLARREAEWAHTSRDQRIVGYRRVLGYSTKGNCGLCVVAASRVYASQDLAPIHAHCGCSVQPVYRDAPAPKVDRAFLDQIYADAGSSRYGDLRVIRVNDEMLPAGVARRDVPEMVAVTITPELGPTLVAA